MGYNDNFVETPVPIDFEAWRSPYWTSTIVQGQFELAQGYANSVWSTALQAAQALGDLSFSFTPSAVEFIDGTIIPGTVGVTVPPPNISITPITAPPKPPLSIPTLTSIEIPTFDATVNINIPPTPNVDFPPPITEDPPSVGDYEFPPDPNIVLPPVPVLDEIVLPPPPEDINLPDFSVDKPTHTLNPPGNSFIYNEEIYTSELGDAVDARLLEEVLSSRTILEDGTITYGSGIPSGVEEAIYLRGLDRLTDQIENDHEQALSYFSSKGHDLPPGALSGRLLEANAQAARQTLDHSQTVMIQAFELAQKNNQFIIDAGLKREQSMMDHFNAVANRALQSAWYVQQAAILVYTAELDLFKAEMAMYATEAQVYEAKIRAQLSILEKYKLQLDAARILGELNQLEVQIYTALVGANESLVRIFSAQVDSVKVKYEADVTRLRAYGLGIENYTAQVNAITARYDAYKTAVSGELAKSQVFSDQVKAYLGQVQAKGIEAGINIQEAQFTIDYNNNLIAEYTADISKFNSLVSQAIETSRTEATIYDAVVKSAEINLESQKTQALVSIEASKSTLSNTIAQIELAIKEADINIQGANAANALTLEALKNAGLVSSQLAASSMSSIHASAALSHSTDKRRSYDETKDIPTTSYEYRGTISN